MSAKPHGAPEVVAIRTLVASKFGLEPDELLQPWRAKTVARARLVSYYLARKHTQRSYSELGSDFLRDHSTVISGIRQAKALIESDERLRRRVESIESELASLEAAL